MSDLVFLPTNLIKINKVGRFPFIASGEEERGQCKPIKEEDSFNHNMSGETIDNTTLQT